MRSLARRPVSAKEEESAFVSMTDMTVSFLFIIMILLAFFAAKYNEQDMVPRSDLDAMRLQRDDAREEVARLQKQLLVLRDELQTTQTERDKARARLASLEAELAQTRAENTALRLERERLSEYINNLNGRIGTLLLRIAELESRIQSLLAEIEQLKQRNPLEDYLTKAAAARREILERLKGALATDFPDLVMEISVESDALRFQGEGLFRTGEYVLRAQPRKIVETIAVRLDEILPCYTLGEFSVIGKAQCNEALALIESVQIEGHTDSQGRELSNLELSTARANSTFVAMLARINSITRHLNYRDQPVLSVAGYGQMRPLATNATVEGRSSNRRIDLRIIMYTPRGVGQTRSRSSRRVSEWLNSQAR